MGEEAEGKKGMVVLLAILGMVCWGIAPIFAKIGLNNINPMAGLAIRTMFAAGLIVSWVVIGGMFNEVKNIPLHTWVFIAMEAVLATLVGDFAYYSAIKHGDVSLVTIIMSSSPLVTILCAVIFLGEQISMLRIAGAVLIVAGIVLII
jgi:bacterial/archaeal transporter family protein